MRSTGRPRRSVSDTSLSFRSVNCKSGARAPGTGATGKSAAGTGAPCSLGARHPARVTNSARIIIGSQRQDNEILSISFSLCLCVFVVKSVELGHDLPIEEIDDAAGATGGMSVMGNHDHRLPRAIQRA